MVCVAVKSCGSCHVIMNLDDIFLRGGIGNTDIEFEVLLESYTRVLVVSCESCDAVPKHSDALPCGQTINSTEVKILAFMRGLSISLLNSSGNELLHGHVGTFNVNVTFDDENADIMLKIKKMQVNVALCESLFWCIQNVFFDFCCRLTTKVMLDIRLPRRPLAITMDFYAWKSTS